SKPCVRIQKSLYGLKQSGRQWYNKYSEVLKSQGFAHSIECPSVFYKHTDKGPVITSIYVDDTNVMDPEKKAVDKVKTFLKSTFEMKDFGQVSGCIGIDIEHLHQGVFLLQSKMIQKI
ncbi:DNA-directed DNA polymerase, partial [Synchytrium microbalum]